jgi:cell division protein FtsI (penicillin-binding protein 3)
MIDSIETSDRPTAAFETAWRPLVKNRTVVILATLAIWAVVLEARLVYLQVIRHDDLAARARQQQLDIVKPAAVRGDLVDRHGMMLAYSVDASSIVADPMEIKDDASTVAALCRALADCTPAEINELTAKFESTARWVEVRKARAVSPRQSADVAALDLRGITLVGETRRYYPKLELASHLLGYVGADNQGLGGLESRLDEIIRGREGRVLVQTDARNHQMSARVEQPATAGATVELTIDLSLQYIAERELKAGVQANRAEGGMAVVMDPQTGEILALANYPTFNPNAFGRASDDERRNRAIQDLYEPGSTFKIVTASAAIEEGVVKPSDLIDCSPGYITFPGRRPIRDVHRYGILTFEDVIVKSSNVGAIRAGLRVGAERLSRYVRRFGFGERIAPDFAGEQKGIVHGPADMPESELASVSMGYHVGVTAVQMAAAVSAVANGGLLMEPRLVRATTRDGVRTATQPKEIRRAIARDTAATLTTIMEGVVQRGTARAAALERYQVAGKTGTAKKVINGQYSDTYNASFIGFVPSRRPALAIVVVIDSPHAGRIYGGAVAAPIFKRIANASLQQLGVPATINPTPPVVVAADFEPSPVESVPVLTVIPAASFIGGQALMPDVRGLSGRDALRALGAVGLAVRMKGDGFVHAQIPQPGEPIDSGGTAALQLQRTIAPSTPVGGGR